MRIVHKSKEKLVAVGNINDVLANAIRRTANEIPILAVDELEIYKNDCVLNDQMLAHRVGLVPLKNEKLTMKEDCDCEGKGCGKCTIQLKLSSKGPATVYAKDLKGGAEPVFGEIPIVILDAEQELEFVAHARLGRGIEHAKFSPGIIYYREVYSVGGKQEKFKDIIEKYNREIAFMEKGGKGIVADLPDACAEELENVEGVEVKATGEKVIIVESFGQIDAKEIFLHSIDAIRKNLKQVEKLDI